MASVQTSRADRLVMPGGHWPGLGVVFTGFRAIAAQPVLWGAWTALSVVTVAATVIATYAVSRIGSHAVAVPHPITSVTYLSVVIDRAWRQLVVLPIFCAGYGVSMAAYSRAVLERREGEWSYIRLGAAELRIAIAMLIFTVTLSVAESAFGAAIGSVMMSGVEGSTGGLVALSLALLAGYLVFVVAAVWLASQLWLGAADILARGTIDVRAVWRLGAGRRARLFWAFLIAALMSGLLVEAGQAVGAFAWAGIEHQPLVDALMSLVQRNDAAASPWRLSTWAVIGLYSIFGGVGFAVLICPAAKLYGVFSPKVDEVF